MFSQKQQENIRAASIPGLRRAIGSACLGLLCTGGALGLTVAFGLVGFIAGGLPLLVIGGGMWWMAYTPYRQWRAYNTSSLRLATAPVPLGTSLRARVQIPVSNEQPISGFQVRVACTQGSGDDEEVVWEERTSVRGQPGSFETEVPITLDLPAQPLWAAERETLERLSWTMGVAASFDDKPDYAASFDLPVSVPDDLER